MSIAEGEAGRGDLDRGESVAAVPGALRRLDAPEVSHIMCAGRREHGRRERRKANGVVVKVRGN